MAVFGLNIFKLNVKLISSHIHRHKLRYCRDDNKYLMMHCGKLIQEM